MIVLAATAFFVLAITLGAAAVLRRRPDPPPHVDIVFVRYEKGTFGGTTTDAVAQSTPSAAGVSARISPPADQLLLTIDRSTTAAAPPDDAAADSPADATACEDDAPTHIAAPRTEPADVPEENLPVHAFTPQRRPWWRRFMPPWLPTAPTRENHAVAEEAEPQPIAEAIVDTPVRGMPSHVDASATPNTSRAPVCAREEEEDVAPPQPPVLEDDDAIATGLLPLPEDGVLAPPPPPPTWARLLGVDPDAIPTDVQLDRVLASGTPDQIEGLAIAYRDVEWYRAPVHAAIERVMPDPLHILPVVFALSIGDDDAAMTSVALLFRAGLEDEAAGMLGRSQALDGFIAFMAARTYGQDGARRWLALGGMSLADADTLLRAVAQAASQAGAA